MKNKKVKIGIIGITSITGKELWKILSIHRYAQVQIFASHSNKGKLVSSLGIKSNKQVLDIFCEKTYEQCCINSDVIFLCLSHCISMKFVKEIHNFSCQNKLKCPKIIDLSGDFRIKNVNLYKKFYKEEHIFPSILDKFVYGLPEINREKIKMSNFISNPGCYPTTIILGLAPIIKIIKTIIVDSKSGYSGGGKKLVEEYENSGGNNTYSYNVNGEHRHIPEIEEQLSLLSKKKEKIFFTPHVVPQYQGMLSDIYIKTIEKDVKIENLVKIYKKFYSKDPFIKILEDRILPKTKNVLGTNFCEIGFGKQQNFPHWIKIFVAIDNLIKGAAGQAVQNMNIMFNIDEEEGLK